MHIKPAALAFATACVMASSITSGYAASPGKKSIDKITCEEFTGLEESYQPTYVAWAWGYNQGQSEPSSVVMDVSGVEQLTPYVVDACQKEPKASFWSKVRSKLQK